MRSLETISRSSEIISRSSETISRSSETILRSSETILRFSETIPRSSETISRSSETVGGWDIDVPCDRYGIYMLVLRSAESFSSRLDVALRLFVVSEHQFLKNAVEFPKISFRRIVPEESLKVSEDHFLVAED